MKSLFLIADFLLNGSLTGWSQKKYSRKFDASKRKNSNLANRFR